MGSLRSSYWLRAFHSQDWPGPYPKTIQKINENFDCKISNTHDALLEYVECRCPLVEESAAIFGWINSSFKAIVRTESKNKFSDEKKFEYMFSEISIRVLMLSSGNYELTKLDGKF